MDSNQEWEPKQEVEEYVAVGENGLSDAAEASAAVDEDSEAQQVTDENSPKPAQSAEKPKGGRRDILHILCGAYLLYLAYKLIPGFIGADLVGWSAMRIVSLIGSVVFAVVGVILLVGVVKRFLGKTNDHTK